MYGPGYWGGNWRWNWGNYNNNWWAWATAGAISGWLNHSSNQPIYYDYGTNIYYEGDKVYYDGQPIASTEAYANQAQAIAENIPEVEPEDVQWLPLGVFALTKKGDSVEDSTLFLQLAVSKEGIIAGTLQNTSTGKSTEVEGAVDQDSQRAAWGPIGKDWPIMETGVYNLSENQLDALVHFEDGSTQQWSLARMDDPEADKAK